MLRQNVWSLGGGLLLIGLGILFFIAQFLPGNAMRYLWPFFILAVGALFFMGMVAGGKAAGALAIPGSILTMLGLIFLVQAILGIWATWAYAWALLIVAVGIGLSIFGLWSENDQLRLVGRLVMVVGGLLFLVFGLFFEAIFALSGARSLGGVLWAVLLIGAGVLLLLGRERLSQWAGPLERGVANLAGVSAGNGEQVAFGAAAPLDLGSLNTSDETAAPGAIQRLVFRSIGNMTITQGENEGLVIHASDEMRARVRSQVNAGTLEIWYQTDWWEWLGFGMWGSSNIHYELTVRSLESIRAVGVGNIKADRLITPRFEVVHTGAGNVTIGSIETDELVARMDGVGNLEINGGRANRQTVNQNGAGSYSADRLASQVAVVQLNGLGSASVWASEQLDARVNGLGSIEYYGNPQVSKRVNGLGSVNARGTR